MKKFLVTVSLPENLDEEFWKLIPQHRVMVNELMNQGKIVLYTVSANRARGWMIIQGNSKKEILDIIRALPISGFYTQVEADELFIYDSISEIPEIVMN